MLKVNLKLSVSVKTWKSNDRKAIKKWKINRKESFMIGDRLIDLKAAKIKNKIFL